MAMTLKHQLKLFLEHYDMTAAQLSRKAGVSQQVLSLWMRGGEPRRMSQIKKVAEVFSVSVDHLCFGEGLDQKGQRVLELDTLLGEDQWVGGLFEVRFRRVKGGK